MYFLQSFTAHNPGIFHMEYNWCYTHMLNFYVKLVGIDKSIYKHATFAMP